MQRFTQKSALGFKAGIFGSVWVFENMSLHHLKRKVSCVGFFLSFPRRKNSIFNK